MGDIGMPLVIVFGFIFSVVMGILVFNFLRCGKLFNKVAGQRGIYVYAPREKHAEVSRTIAEFGKKYELANIDFNSYDHCYSANYELKNMSAADVERLILALTEAVGVGVDGRNNFHVKVS